MLQLPLQAPHQMLVQVQRQVQRRQGHLRHRLGAMAWTLTLCLAPVPWSSTVLQQQQLHQPLLAQGLLRRAATLRLSRQDAGELLALVMPVLHWAARPGRQVSAWYCRSTAMSNC